MANEKNLKPQNQRTKEEQRKIATMGGVASGKVRRERKLFREILAELLTYPMKDKSGKPIVSPITGEPMTVDETMLVAQIKKAANGDTRAFNAIADTMGERTLNLKQEVDAKVVKTEDKSLKDVPDDLLEEVLKHINKPE